MLLLVLVLELLCVDARKTSVLHIDWQHEMGQCVA
jgi:hypothetical protein